MFGKLSWDSVNTIEDTFVYPIVDAIGKIPGVNNVASIYWIVKIIFRIMFYGFLACLLASVTGTKKAIDKKMRWAQR